MFSATAAIDTEWLNTLQQVHEIIPDAIDDYARRDLRPFVSQRVDATLRVEPPVRAFPEDYPLEWTSEKQRRYVMAKLRREDNLPYQRTHEYVRGWHVWGDYTRGLTAIDVFHDGEVSEFVGGRQQQLMHRITGWANAPDVLQVLSIDLNERIEVGLPVVLDQAFVDW